MSKLPLRFLPPAADEGADAPGLASLESLLAEAGEDLAADGADAPDAAADADGAGEAAPFETVVIAGVGHLVPAAVKAHIDALAVQAGDAAALAKDREAFAADRAAFDGELSMQTEHRALEALNGLTSAYEAFDWSGAEQANPAFAQAAFGRYLQARGVREAMLAQIESRGRAALAWQKDTQGRAAREALRDLASSVAGWSADTPKALADFAKAEYGFSADEFEGVTDARLLKLLHGAWAAAAEKARVARARAGQATQPAVSLKGAGAMETAANTDDFAAFERMAEKKMKPRLVRTIG